MSIVIVPNSLRDSIYEKIDKELANHPKLLSERESIYQQLLAYFDEHGTIPDFRLQEK